MSDDIDFSDLLSAPVDSIRKPGAYPVGSYNGRIQNHELKTLPSGTPYLRYTVKLSGAGEDVDLGDLLQANPAGRFGKLVEKDFYLTPDEQWKVVEFVKSGSYDVSGKSLKAIIGLPVGQAVLVKLGHRTGKDGTVYNRVTEITLA